MAEALDPGEREVLVARLGEWLASGRGRRRSAVAYLCARRA